LTAALAARRRGTHEKFTAAIDKGTTLSNEEARVAFKYHFSLKLMENLPAKWNPHSAVSWPCRKRHLRVSSCPAGPPPPQRFACRRPTPRICLRALLAPTRSSVGALGVGYVQQLNLPLTPRIVTIVLMDFVLRCDMEVYRSRVRAREIDVHVECGMVHGPA
jgi:hypothetical protein